jgi:hypothetical protein
MVTNGWVSSERTTENNADYPKGCYTVIQAESPYTMYWNSHPTGTNDRPNVLAKRLCKKDGAPPPKFSFSAKNTNGPCPSGYRAPTKGECTKDNLGTLVTGNFYEEIEQSQPNFPKGCYRCKGANLVWTPPPRHREHGSRIRAGMHPGVTSSFGPRAPVREYVFCCCCCSPHNDTHKKADQKGRGRVLRRRLSNPPPSVFFQFFGTVMFVVTSECTYLTMLNSIT